MASIKAIVVIGRISSQGISPAVGGGTYTKHWPGNVDVIEATDELYFQENDRGVVITEHSNGPMTVYMIPWHRIGEVRYN